MKTLLSESKLEDVLGLSVEKERVISLRGAKINPHSEGYDLVPSVGEPVLVSERHANVLTRFVPLTFFDQIDDATLRNSIVSYYLNKVQLPVKLVTRGNELINIVSENTVSYNIAKCFDVFKTSPIYKDVKGYDVFIDGVSQLDVVTNKAEEPPTKKGDFSHAGVRIMTDGIRPKVQPFVYRMVCSNGMIAEHSYGGRLRSYTSETLNSDLIGQINRAYKDVGEVLLPNFMSLDGKQVEGNLERLIILLSEEYGLPSRELPKLLRRSAELHQPCSFYDVVNLVTSMANEEESLGSRSSLQSLGGYITESMGVHRCSQCQRRI